MKTCPICGSKAVDRATTCFECLYSFADHSTEACIKTSKWTAPKAVKGAQAQLEKSEKAREGSGAEAMPVIQKPAQMSKIKQNAKTVAPVSQLPEKVVGDIFLEMWRRGTLEKRYLSHNGSLYVGSAPFNDVSISSHHVARRALHIFRVGETIYAEVLSDAHPIYLNGQQLDGTVPLRALDALSFEDIRLVLA